jgi:hypothetical protein
MALYIEYLCEYVDRYRDYLGIKDDDFDSDLVIYHLIYHIIDDDYDRIYNEKLLFKELDIRLRKKKIEKFRK